MKTILSMKHPLTIFVMTVALIVTIPGNITAETTKTEYSQPIQQSAPYNVRAKATKKGSIVVKWDKIPNAKSYNIYRATKIDGNYKRVKAIKKTKFKDKKIRPKKTYFYKISINMPSDTISASSYESDVVSAKLKVKKSFKVKAYSYSGGGYTKSGKKAKVGRIAVDPKVIKLGTWLYVEGYGVCQACDTGGNIKGKTIDVYKNTQKESRKWGVKRPKVYIIG